MIQFDKHIVQLGWFNHQKGKSKQQINFNFITQALIFVHPFKYLSNWVGLKGKNATIHRRLGISPKWWWFILERESP